MSAPRLRADLRDAPLSVDEALSHVRRPGAGGIAVFLGVVRDENVGRAVTRLEYSAYVSMARPTASIRVAFERLGKSTGLSMTCSCM